MSELLVNLAKLAIGFFMIAGPVALSIVRLRYRDRREGALNLKALMELNSPELRGLFSVSVKNRLVGADHVVVDLWGCSRDQIWDLMERLSVCLPAQVRVEVNGISTGRSHSKLTLALKSRSCHAACSA